EGTQRCGIVSKLPLQEVKRHRVGIPDIGYRPRACAAGAIEGPLGDAHENVAAVLVLEVESISEVITACRINRSCRNLMTKRIRGRLTKSLEPVANGTKRQEQRRHALLPVDQFQDTIAAGTDNNAPNEIL